jgi:RNA polymerase sigma factor (sigma-70 family)
MRSYHPRVPTDAELLRAWAEGDGASGEQLYRRHVGLVFAFFRTKLIDDIEDLVQVTFLTTQHKAPAHRGGSVRAFILGIARYILLEHLRTKARQETAIEPLESSISDLVTSPSSMLRREESHDRLRLALQSLPIDQQIALELRYWHELDMDEIAEIQEVAPGTVRTRLHRAREALGELIDEADQRRLPPAMPTGK